MYFLSNINSKLKRIVLFNIAPFSFLFCAFLCSSEIFAQETLFEKGTVVDSISVGGSSETYALYLPQRYNPNQLSAVVFIFDPSGNGKNGIQPFLDASERFNYVLICSNNSRNGLFEANFEIINRLFSEVFKTFNIDEKQIYTSGFSGGARLATAVASLTGQIQGVIACGASFSPNTTHTPGPGASFSYVGLVGNEDMNYQEMYGSKAWLETFGIENELFINNDTHKWPPSSQIQKALGWLELQAYNRNIRDKDVLFIQNYYEDLYKDARAFENNERTKLAVEEYERLITNFAKYYNLDSIRGKIKKLKSSKKYRAEIENEKEIEKLELEVRSKFVDRFMKEIDSKKPAHNYKWWNKELKKLDEKYISSKDSAYRKMGKRIGFAVYAMAVETGNSKRRDGEFEKAIYAHQLVTVVLPEAAWPYYLLAIDFAMINNREKVIANLKLSISKGWTNKKAILETEAFEKYREDVQFLALLAELK